MRRPLHIGFGSLMVAAAVVSTLGFGALYRTRQFAWLEGEGIALGGNAGCVRDADVLRVTFEDAGASVEVLVPANARPGTPAPASLRVVDAKGLHLGTGTLEVLEAGRFLAATLAAEVEGRRFTGALRVRVESATELVRSEPVVAVQ